MFSSIFITIFIALDQSEARISGRIARYVYFAGLDAELLEMAGILREVLWERDRFKSGDTQFMDFVIEHLSAY